jgi:putative transposase
MEEDQLTAAVRYVSLHPVRACLVERACDWPWSSVRAHLAGGDDGVVTVAAVERVGPFAVSADERFDEGADFGPRASCGDHRTAGRPGRLAEAPRASTCPTARAAQTLAEAMKSTRYDTA